MPSSPLLTSAQRKYLRGLAHALKPIVQIGQKGVTENLLAAIDDALTGHELIKVKFTDFKEDKDELLPEILSGTGAALAGVIGHVAIIYRPHPKPEKRKIRLPRS